MEFAAVVIIFVNILLAVNLAVGTTPIMVWWERRVSGFMQGRSGPNRAHIGGIRLGGLVQSVADMLKLAFKEDFIPAFIKHKMFFIMAPVIMFICSFLTVGVIPFADRLVIDGVSYTMQALPIDLGILWFLAFAGLSVYGIVLGGYSSTNKFGILSSIRAIAQVISYEASMGLAIISMLIVYGSVNLSDIAAYQGGLIFGFIPAWGIIMQPLAALIFIVAAFAETNRAPFDLAEGESELVAGYHTEYSAMRFGLFQVSEFAAMSAASALIVTMFFGGYQVPWLNTQTLQENINIVLFAMMIILPATIYFFTQWIKKNNTWIDESDPRAKESKILIKIFKGIAIGMVVILALILIFGLGTNGTNIATAMIQVSTFLIKFFLINFFFVWIRWTLLRFRYDQLQLLGWKVLLPLALLNIVITATYVLVLGA